ncbi:MAG: acetyltransferase [Alphaproteobacteria bacterium]|nr:acetyltransferase [Alphaproteobacteria bacterium]
MSAPAGFLLVGAGGHAQGVADAVRAAGGRVAAFADPHAAHWLADGGDAPAHHRDDEAARAAAVRDALALALGLGGTDGEALARRLALLDAYLDAGIAAPPVVHPTAVVARSALMDEGVTVLARAVLQPFAHAHRGVLINTGAIVEHGARLGAGAHIGPGAIVLGGAEVGRAAMIGAGAVILPGARAPDGALVKALTRFPA